MTVAVAVAAIGCGCSCSCSYGGNDCGVLGKDEGEKEEEGEVVVEDSRDEVIWGETARSEMGCDVM